MSPEEYARRDALDLAEQLKQKQVSQRELIEACAAIVERLDGELNAVVSKHFDFAMDQAATMATRAPFLGCPFGAKEEGAYYNGVPSGSASKLYPVADPGYDTVFVDRYRKAGLNLTIKLNMPELAASVTTESSVHGICKNPWNPAKSTGGSSGGSAAAVAAGYVPAAYGNDGAGSIRIPASACGVFGMKPTRGRVPKGPILSDEWSGNVVDHVLTRSVRDSAAILDIASGPDVGAPYDAPAAEGTFLQAVMEPPKKKLKIAFSTKAPTGVKVDDACVDAAVKTAKLCEALGHHVEERELAYDGAEMFDRLFTLMAAHVARETRALYRAGNLEFDPAYLEPTNYALLERGLKISAVDFLENLFELSQFARKIGSFFVDYDLYLTPTLAKPTVDHGVITTSDKDLDHFWKAFVEFIPFTPIANITGVPAMSVPLHWTADGLPVGSHFMARLGDEATLFSLAAQLENSAPWSGRYPPISAFNA